MNAIPKLWDMYSKLESIFARSFLLLMLMPCLLNACRNGNILQTFGIALSPFPLPFVSLPLIPLHITAVTMTKTTAVINNNNSKLLERFEESLCNPCFDEGKLCGLDVISPVQDKY